MWSKATFWLIIALALTHAQDLDPNSTEEGTETIENETGEISREIELEPDTDGNSEIDPGGNSEPDPDGNTDPDPDGNTDPDPDENTNPDTDDNTDPDPDDNTNPDPDDNTDPDPDENSNSEPVESEQENIPEVVETDHGPVTAVNLHGELGIRSYLDIPYGKFDKLFEAPTDPSAWLVHHVIEHSKRCPQLQHLDTVVGDQNCLTLSVFTPSNVINAPVLFHIHDGDFTIGSADPTIYGPEHLVPRGVILVLPNYRLGPLGFLCAPGSDVIPGNAGLKDLTLALDWTKRNIEAFGGDPSNIVVSGDGNAGALVGYLTISPTSRHYIAKAIIESGSVFSHLAIDRNPYATAISLASRLVNVNASETELEIFENTDVNALLQAANHTKFKPCVDTGNEMFLNATPWSILQEMKTNISFMIGTADSAGMHEALEYTESSIYELNRNFSVFLPKDLGFKCNDDVNYFSDQLKRLYFGELDITIRDREKLAVWHTDTTYLGPAIRLARQLVEAGATVYFYEFSFVGALNRERNALPQPLHGAARGDVVGYVFCQGGDMPDQGSAENHMVDIMAELWIDFMMTGKPSELWNSLEKSAASEEEWLSIGQQLSQRQGIHGQRMDIWTDLYDLYFVDRNLARRVKGTLVAVAVVGMTSLWRLL